MKLLIGIATYKRPKKLLRLMQSLNKQTYKDFKVHIIADNNDSETQKEFKDWKFNLIPEWRLEVNNEHGFVIGIWNKIIQSNLNMVFWDFEYFIGLCDDVELLPNALEEIVKRHEQYFPDTDGVVGFNQHCPGHPDYTFKWWGQTLMGKKFIERYKGVNYQICCPDYKHFYQDEEMYDYANSLCKFSCCEEAILNHYHPGFIKEEIDDTHHIIRDGKTSPINYDSKKRSQRKKAGYLWGRDFNLIGGDHE